MSHAARLRGEQTLRGQGQCCVSKAFPLGLACDLWSLYRAVTPRRRHSMATCRAAGPGSTSKWTRCYGCGRGPRTSTGEQAPRARQCPRHGLGGTHEQVTVTSAGSQEAGLGSGAAQAPALRASLAREAQGQPGSVLGWSRAGGAFMPVRDVGTPDTPVVTGRLLRSHCLGRAVAGDQCPEGGDLGKGPSG